MACIIQAVINFQSDSSPKQPDPIHISSHYLLSSHPGPFEVHVRPLRLGRRYSNVTADLYQQGEMNITSHVIVGTLPDPLEIPLDRSMPTLVLPHPCAIRTPFQSHPAVSHADNTPSTLTFGHRMKMSCDKVVAEKALRRVGTPAHDDGGVDCGMWYELLGEENKRLELAAIPLFADLCRNPPSLLPNDIRPGTSWFPTLVLGLEFKFKLSNLPDYISRNTFGVFSTGRFIWQGRHEVRSEVWTSPSSVGTGDRVDPNWRENQICVAIATQMALTIPIEVNKRKAEVKASL